MIEEFEGKKPSIAENVFIAENATVIGNVKISSNSSVYFGAIIRADEQHIHIGKNVSIQDNCAMHPSPKDPVELGDNITIGHNAIIHGCKIKSNCIIGMGAILLNRCEIGENCIIGAGALVTEGTKIPDNSIALGMPAKVIKQVTPEHLKRIKNNWQQYVDLNQRYLKWQKGKKPPLGL